jgi:response regulator of citrate/malate metabolism
MLGGLTRISALLFFLLNSYILSKKMTKVTPETLLKAIPSQPHTSITMGQLAKRFGCRRQTIAEKADFLIKDGKIEKFQVMGKTVHYRKKIR